MCTHRKNYSSAGVSEPLEQHLNSWNRFSALKNPCTVTINWVQSHTKFSCKIVIKSHTHRVFLVVGFLQIDDCCFAIWEGSFLIKRDTFLGWDWGKTRNYWSLLFPHCFTLFEFPKVISFIGFCWSFLPNFLSIFKSTGNTRQSYINVTLFNRRQRQTDMSWHVGFFLFSGLSCVLFSGWGCLCPTYSPQT